MPGPYTTDKSWELDEADILPPGELDITDIQRSIGEGAGDQLSELVSAALQVGKKPDYKKGTADTWSEYAPEGGKVRFAGEGRVVELAREPDGNWPPFWWGESEQYLQDNIDTNALLPVNKSELKSRYHKNLKKLRDESAGVMTRVGGTGQDRASETAYKHVPFDQYGGPILIGFDGESPVMPSDQDLGGAGSPDFTKNKSIAKMQFEEAMYRQKLLDAQQRPFQKASGRVDPTAGPLDLLGFGLGAVKAGAQGTQALVKSFLKKQRGGQIRQPRLYSSGRMERMGDRGPVPMLPSGAPRLGVPGHQDAMLRHGDDIWEPPIIPGAYNLSGHKRPGFGFADPEQYTWRSTPFPGRRSVPGRPASAGITPEQHARRMKEWRQTGGFRPSGPRQYFSNPDRYPKPATNREAYFDAIERGGGLHRKSKISSQELERRRSMYERLGYWNTAIPAALATPEIANQMQELDEYGDALRMLEGLQHGGE